MARNGFNNGGGYYKPKSPTEQMLQRRKYFMAFSRTMIKIWKEQIQLLDVIDTGYLLNNIYDSWYYHNKNFSELLLSQQFPEYGIYQDYGTGKEVWRGNPGDIGRPKVRKRKKWFSRKYYASVMNIKEFMAESLGKQFLGIFQQTMDGGGQNISKWTKV